MKLKKAQVSRVIGFSQQFSSESSARNRRVCVSKSLSSSSSGVPPRPVLPAWQAKTASVPVSLEDEKASNERRCVCERNARFSGLICVAGREVAAAQMSRTRDVVVNHLFL